MCVTFEFSAEPRESCTLAMIWSLLLPVFILVTRVTWLFSILLYFLSCWSLLLNQKLTSWPTYRAGICTKQEACVNHVINHESEYQWRCFVFSAHFIFSALTFVLNLWISACPRRGSSCWRQKNSAVCVLWWGLTGQEAEVGGRSWLQRAGLRPWLLQVPSCLRSEDHHIHKIAIPAFQRWSEGGHLLESYSKLLQGCARGRNPFYSMTRVHLPIPEIYLALKRT